MTDGEIMGGLVILSFIGIFVMILLAAYVHVPKKPKHNRDVSNVQRGRGDGWEKVNNRMSINNSNTNKDWH